MVKAISVSHFKIWRQWNENKSLFALTIFVVIVGARVNACELCRFVSVFTRASDKIVSTDVNKNQWNTLNELQSVVFVISENQQNSINVMKTFYVNKLYIPTLKYVWVWYNIVSMK